MRAGESSPGGGPREEGLALVQALRQADPDRYLTVVAAPPPGDRLAPLLGLFLLNAELARTGDVAQEALLADLRLKWWYDALGEAAAAGSHAQPALAALAPALADGSLPLAELRALVEQRQAEQEPHPFADLAAFEHHAAAGGGRLGGLAARLLGSEGDEARAAEAVGTAFALLGLLRAAGHHAARGRLLLPADQAVAAGATLQSLAEGRDGAALAPLAREVGAAAATHLRSARRLQARLPRRRMVLFLPAALCDLSLARLAARSWDPLAPGFVLPAPGRAWRLLLHKWRGRT